MDYSFKSGDSMLKGALDMTNSIVDAAMTIEDQYNAITKAFGLPKVKEPVPQAEPELDSKDPKSLFKSLAPSKSATALDRLSKPTKKVAPVKKNKPNGADLLLDFDAPATSSSGYATNETGNSAASSTPAGTGSQQPPPVDLLGMEESFFKDKAEARMLDDAMVGNNLLAMVEEPRNKFNDMLSDLLKATSGSGSSQAGSAMMDFFVDPTALFASERHPALQEVLKVLNKSKHFRGR